MIKVNNKKLISFCEQHKNKNNEVIKGDIFFEISSKFIYEKKFFGEGFFYSPIMKYSFSKIFALKLI